MECAFCSKKLSEKETESYDPYASNFMCEEHFEYRHIFNIPILKKEMGLITINDYPDNMKDCSICRAKLTEEELNNLHKNDFIITCNEHKEVRKMFHLNYAIDFFEFKKIYPNAELESDDGRNKFSKWINEKQKQS